MANIKSKIVLPVIYMRHFLVLMEEHGLQACGLLAEAGIQPDELKQDDGTIDFTRCDRLISLGQQYSGVDGLGWQLGLRLNLPSHGILATAFLASRYIGEMLTMSVRYIATRFPLLVLSLSVEDETASLQFDEAFDLGENRRFYIEAFAASHQVMRRFTFGSQACEGHSLQLALEWKSYYDHFDFSDLDVSYGHDVHQFRFPARYISMPMPMADDITREAAERKCQQLLEDLKVETVLLGRVLAFIRNREGVMPSLEQTADYLCLSPRTLRRQLQDMNITYRSLVNKERKRLALYYLKNTRLTVEEISERLDYNDPSNFGRAFRRWTGHSPKYYRQSSEQESELVT